MLNCKEEDISKLIVVPFYNVLSEIQKMHLASFVDIFFRYVAVNPQILIILSIYLFKELRQFIHTCSSY